jgi:hypothetical protein
MNNQVTTIQPVKIKTLHRGYNNERYRGYSL